jgi:hypothetical protein
LNPNETLSLWRCCVPCRITIKTFPDEPCPRCGGELERGGTDTKGKVKPAMRARMREGLRARGRVFP